MCAKYRAGPCNGERKSTGAGTGKNRREKQVRRTMGTAKIPARADIAPTPAEGAARAAAKWDRWFRQPRDGMKKPADEQWREVVAQIRD
jgi:hypothetical protein